MKKRVVLFALILCSASSPAPSPDEPPSKHHQYFTEALKAQKNKEYAAAIELYQAVAEILAHVYKTYRYYFHRLKARRLEGVSSQKSQF